MQVAQVKNKKKKTKQNKTTEDECRIEFSWAYKRLARIQRMYYTDAMPSHFLLLPAQAVITRFVILSSERCPPFDARRVEHPPAAFVSVVLAPEKQQRNRKKKKRETRGIGRITRRARGAGFDMRVIVIHLVEFFSFFPFFAVQMVTSTFFEQYPAGSSWQGRRTAHFGS